jgi:hypothetical protein
MDEKKARILRIVMLLVAFLAGFLPQYIKVVGLRKQVGELQQQAELAALKDSIGRLYLQTNQKNFGLASATASEFFNRARAVASRTPDANVQKALQDATAKRDAVTAELAKGDAAAIQDVQNIYAQIISATATPPSP